MSEQAPISHLFDPAEHRRHSLEEGSGWSMHAADAQTTAETEPFFSSKPTSKPLRELHRIGHVRDFADGGRADEYRGGMIPPQTDEAKSAYEHTAGQIEADQDYGWLVNLQAAYLTGEIDYEEALPLLYKRFAGDALGLRQELLGDGKYRSSAHLLPENEVPGSRASA